MQSELISMISLLANQKVEIDVIGLCESFLSDEKMSLLNVLNYNLHYLNRCSMKNGGVAILVKKDLEFTVRDELSIFKEGYFESCFIEIHGKHK